MLLCFKPQSNCTYKLTARLLSIKLKYIDFDIYRSFFGWFEKSLKGSFCSNKKLSNVIVQKVSQKVVCCLRKRAICHVHVYCFLHDRLFYSIEGVFSRCSMPLFNIQDMASDDKFFSEKTGKISRVFSHTTVADTSNL